MQRQWLSSTTFYWHCSRRLSAALPSCVNTWQLDEESAIQQWNQARWNITFQMCCILRKRLWGKDWDWKHPWCDSHYIVSTLARHRLSLFLSHNEQNICIEKEKITVFSLQGLVTRRRRWWNLRTASYRLPCQSSLHYLPSCKTLWRW